MLNTLIMDIETSPMLAYVWGRKDVNVALNQIKSDWFLMAWSAKWLGDKASKTFYKDQRHSPDIENDRYILKPLWTLLDKADILITQNGQSFDAKKLNARFIFHGMPPPSSYKHLDTYRIARHVASFTSNSLEYLSNKLCTKYKKLSHKKYPGIMLWKACLAGDKKAWDEMKHYNIHDTLATEELYMKLRAWAPESMARPYSFDLPEANCRVCGPGSKMWHKGYEYKKAAKYHRYQCQKCFSWTIGGKVK